MAIGAIVTITISLTLVVIWLIEVSISEGWLEVGDDETLYYMDDYYIGPKVNTEDQEKREVLEESAEVKRIEAVS
jgi:hypothetical protein